MVAITVILAAVIGTFVLGLGDQVSDSAPQASFSVSNVSDDEGDGIGFDMTKTGGQDLTTNDLVLVVDGERTNEDLTENSSDLDPTWQTGETAEFAGEGSNLGENERITIALVHDPTGDQVYQTQITTPSDTE